MIKLKEKIENDEFSEYTVVIPSISVGNVAQLSVDLIISTLKMKRIGGGFHPALIDIFGPPAFQHEKSKTTSFELYSDDNKKLLAFQFRSPLIGSMVNDFHRVLIDFIKMRNFKCVIILSSSHAYEKHLIESTSFEYLVTDAYMNEYKDCIEKQNWKKFEGGSVVHGSGNGKRLFDIFKENNLSACLLFKYVSEGDNTPDARDMVMEFNNLCQIFDNEDNNGRIQLTIPISWNLLFGNEPPKLIF